MFGATIERGWVVEKIGTAYRVASLTRDGIISPPIPAMGTGEYTADELVYFFLFEDGTGAILALIAQE
jgi:hypothetical protein